MPGGSENGEGVVAEGKLESILRRLQATPDDVGLAKQAGALLFGAGRYGEAMSHYQNAVTASPGDAEAWYWLGTAAKRANALEIARTALEKSLALGYRHVYVHGELAQVLLELRDPKAATSEAEHALELSGQPSERAWLHGFLGDCYLHLADSAKALRHYEAAVSQEPDNAWTEYKLGAARSALGDFEGALPHLEKALENDPRHPDAGYALGLAANRLAKYDLARAALEGALHLMPDDAYAAKELSYAFQGLGNWERAVCEAERTLPSAQDPLLLSSLHGILGYCYGRLGEEERSFSHLQQAVHAEPENAEAQYNLAVAYMDRGDLERARLHLERSVRLAPDEHEYLSSLAQCYLDLGKQKQAEPLLRQLLNTDERDNAHILLVESALDQGHLEEALQLAQTEVESRPQSPVAWIGLSRALRANADTGGAEEALRKAVELDPENRWVQSETEHYHGLVV